MINNYLRVLLVLVLCHLDICAFIATTNPTRHCSISNNDYQKTKLLATRRSFMERLTISSLILSTSILIKPIEQANASGGATAGGAYLLSVC